MELKSQLFTRQDMAARTGIDGSTLNYWMREGVLRPVSGGNGRGNRRRFPFQEVNLAAIFKRLSGAGLGIVALRDLAKMFHSAIEYQSQFVMSDDDRSDLFTIINERSRFERDGHVEWRIVSADEWPDKPRHPPSYMIGSPYESTTKKDQVYLTWDEAVSVWRNTNGKNIWRDDLIDIALNNLPDIWIRHFHNFSTISSIPKKLYSNGEVDYFYRDVAGNWTISANTNASREGIDTFIGLDLELIFWRVWHPESDWARPADGTMTECVEA